MRLQSSLEARSSLFGFPRLEAGFLHRRSEKPANLPGSPQCWKASYSGQGTAEVLVCGYPEGGAFDATQRTPAEGQAVKLIRANTSCWCAGTTRPKPRLPLSLRTIQKSLH